MDQPWIRSPDGIIFGVCKGIADRFKLDVMLVRIIWVLSFFFWGTGLLIYAVIAVSLPKTSGIEESRQGRLFGVCARFAKRFDLDVGLVRAGALLSLICSGGAVFLVYVVLYFVLPTMQEMNT